MQNLMMMMIEEKQNPVEWAQLLYELEDAKEHIENLTKQMNNNGSIEEVDFRIQLGHIYSHLNRSWNSRNRKEISSENTFEEESKFPTDLKTT